MEAPVARYKDVVMPLARWTDASDLAMVRDWFYPHHAQAMASDFARSKLTSKSRSRAEKQELERAKFDPYAPDIKPGEVSAAAAAALDATENEAGNGHMVGLTTIDDAGIQSSTPAPALTMRSEPSKEAIEVNRNRWRGIERVEAYKWHDHRIPHAILATAALVDAQLHYEESYQPSTSRDVGGNQNNMRTSKREGTISTMAIKSIFAMAFCRFVNGFVDRDVARSQKAMRESGLRFRTTTAPTTAKATDRSYPQTDPFLGGSQDEDESDDSIADRGESDSSQTEQLPNKRAKTSRGSTTTPARSSTRRVIIKTGESSMYKHAQTIDMPTSFIDLRHKATHARELPSLNELRAKTEEALQWLWNRWWTVNTSGYHGHISDNDQTSKSRKKRKTGFKTTTSDDPRNFEESDEDEQSNVEDKFQTQSSSSQHLAITKVDPTLRRWQLAKWDSTLEKHFHGLYHHQDHQHNYHHDERQQQEQFHDDRGVLAATAADAASVEFPKHTPTSNPKSTLDSTSNSYSKSRPEQKDVAAAYKYVWQPVTEAGVTRFVRVIENLNPNVDVNMSDSGGSGSGGGDGGGGDGATYIPPPPSSPPPHPYLPPAQSILHTSLA